MLTSNPSPSSIDREEVTEAVLELPWEYAPVPWLGAAVPNWSARPSVVLGPCTRWEMSHLWHWHWQVRVELQKKDLQEEVKAPER